MGTHCCSGSSFDEEFFFREFWSNILLRDKNPKDIEEFISLRAKKGVLLDKEFNKVIDQFLLSKTNDKDADKIYLAFWNEAWQSALLDKTTFELLVSLLFLSANNSTDFLIAYMNIQDNISEYDKKSKNKDKLKKIIKYYLFLLTIMTTDSLQKLNRITENETKIIHELYEDKYIEHTCNKILLDEREDVDITDFLEKNYLLFSNDQKMRKEIQKSYNEVNKITH